MEPKKQRTRKPPAAKVVEKMLASETKEVDSYPEIVEYLTSLSVESDKRIYALSSYGTVYLYNKTTDRWMRITKSFTKD